LKFPQYPEFLGSDIGAQDDVDKVEVAMAEAALSNKSNLRGLSIILSRWEILAIPFVTKSRGWDLSE
jgi:hypothetical protein